MKKNKQKSKLFLVKCLAVAMAATTAMTATMAMNVPSGISSVKAGKSIEAPRVTYNTRETIEFGYYFQEDTNGDGGVDEEDKKQPIKWQILSKNGDELFLLADKALDCKKYNEENKEVTWETCSLRTWLNDTFFNTAFTSAEQKGITTTKVVNVDNGKFGTKGGNNTEDKIFLLSLDEVAMSQYGFRSDRNYNDQARLCEVTTYAKNNGAWTEGENLSEWWLRSPGDSSDSAAEVGINGYASVFGDNVYNSVSAVRPALHMNLSVLNESDYTINETVKTSVKASTYDLIELGNYNGKALQWRVLSKEGDDVFLLADRYVSKNNQYNVKYKDITWATCALRTWLNGDFYNTAFSKKEKSAIKKTTYKNADNPFYGTEGGVDTKDYIALLSLSDIINPAYGFPDKYGCGHESRYAMSLYSDGASQKGTRWWLRSPGSLSSRGAGVCLSGAAGANILSCADVDGAGVDSYYAVRPALHINISALSNLKVVGTVVVGENGIQYYDTEGKRVNGKLPTVVSTKPATIKKFKAKASKGKLQLSWKQVSGASGYNIQYSLKSNFKNAKKVTIRSVKINSKTIKGLKKKRKYYIRIRTYKKSGSKKIIYSAWKKISEKTK